MENFHLCPLIISHVEIWSLNYKNNIFDIVIISSVVIVKFKNHVQYKKLYKKQRLAYIPRRDRNGEQILLLVQVQLLYCKVKCNETAKKMVD